MARGPTRPWTRSSPARQKLARSCSSVSIRTCSGISRVSCRSGCTSSCLARRSGRRAFRVQDFLAYHRLVQRRLEAAIGGPDEASPPTPSLFRNARSAAGGRAATSGARRRPSLPRGRDLEATDQELRCWGVDTLTALAVLPLPLEREADARRAGDLSNACASKPASSSRGGSPARRVHELLAVAAGAGLCRFPSHRRRRVSRPRERSLRRHVRARVPARLDHGDRPARPHYHTRWALRPGRGAGCLRGLH